MIVKNIFKKLGFKFGLPLILLLIAGLGLISVIYIPRLSSNFFTKWFMSDLNKCSEIQILKDHCEVIPKGFVLGFISLTILIVPGQKIAGPSIEEGWLILISFWIYFLIGCVIDEIIKKIKIKHSDKSKNNPFRGY